MLILMHQQQTVFENIVGKGEIALNEQFLFFAQFFLLNQIILSHLFIILTSYLYLVLYWKSLKLAYQVKDWSCFCQEIWLEWGDYKY